MMPVDPAMLETYFQLMNANGLARAYHTAVETGILGAIAQGARTVEEVCNVCSTKERGSRLLLDAMVACGLAERSEGRYRATVIAQMMLFGEYRNLGNKYWDHLESFLKDGEPLVRMDDPAGSEAHYQKQAAILGWMLSPAASEAAVILNARTAPDSILDIGAGSAVWSLSIAALSESVQVTANDWPSVLDTARESAEAMELDERLSMLPGNYHEVEFPKAAFDLVIVANVAHLETIEACNRLFARAAESVKPGGSLVVIDAMAGNGENRDRTAGALYGLGLALRTEHGCVHSIETLKSALMQAGMGEPQFVPLQSPPYMLGMLICPEC